MTDLTNKSLRTDVGKARGLGAAKEGSHHWWAMKITSLALIPLGLWLVYSLMSIAGLEQSQVQAWLKNPMHSAVLALFMLTGLHHSAHGLQVVVEDYVTDSFTKQFSIILITMAHLAAAGFALFAIVASALRV